MSKKSNKKSPKKKLSKKPGASKAKSKKPAPSKKKTVKKLVKKAAKAKSRPAPKKKIAKKAARPVKKIAPKAAPKKNVKKAPSKPTLKKPAPSTAVSKAPARKQDAKKLPATNNPPKSTSTLKVAKSDPKPAAANKAATATAEQEKPRVVKVVKQPKAQHVEIPRKSVIIDIKTGPEPAGRFELEYVVHASAPILFEFLTSPSGLSEWFCDDVNIRNGVYTFKWEENEQNARVVKLVEEKVVRFQWTDKHDNSYFEFRIERDDLTNDISLIVVDFAETQEEKTSSTLLWNSQIDKLLHVLGAYF